MDFVHTSTGGDMCLFKYIVSCKGSTNAYVLIKFEVNYWHLPILHVRLLGINIPVHLDCLQ